MNTQFQYARVIRLIVAILSVGAVSSLSAQEAQWIWSPEHPRGLAAAGDCYFRRAMQLNAVEEASITITADDSYELFVNGRKAGQGNSIRQMERYDITRLLMRGRNVISVRVNNVALGPAALAARVFIKPVDSTWLSFSTDDKWRSTLETVAGWQNITYNDSRWKPAKVYGQLGETAPWDHREEVEATKTSEHSRFQVNSEFAVDEILGNEVVGSLVTMAFNEFGHLIAAQEGGPLLLIYDSDKNGVLDKTRVYCEQVQYIQGILPINGDVFVCGEGAEGPGIYHLRDQDRNGALEKVEKVLGFKGQQGEHGAHALTLGPDGLIYCILGNHVSVDAPILEASPLKNVYEGDLVQPRFEDPGGHARGIKAPGGTLIRMEMDGSKVELVAGGLRNAFDLTFHPNGRLYVHDSDMESDVGAAWYRPTSLYQIVEGGEYGWRSGWANWPEYFVDRVPTLLETGRGSPTGATVYDHHMFPQRYHGSLFLADWSEGRILCVKLTDKGGPAAQSEVFLQGQPLNVTDVAVGPDGHLYFCTGGRGTKGGIYRVQWRGDVPASARELGEGIARAIKQPQLDSAWARQSIATLKKDIGSGWSDLVLGAVLNEGSPTKTRVRALSLMQLFGPAPTPEMLSKLAESPNESLREKAAQLLALHSDSKPALDALRRMARDKDQAVQLAALQTLLRIKQTPRLDDLTEILVGENRYLTAVGRRLLELIPESQWRDQYLAAPNLRLQIQASLVLMTTQPTRENGLRVLTTMKQALDGFVSDRDFADILRLTQVTLARSGLQASDVPDLRQQLVGEFPAGEPLLNRELMRVLTYFNAEEVIPTAIDYLQTDTDIAERVHVAIHLGLMKHKWSATERYALVKFFEESQLLDAGSSVPLYVMNVTKDFLHDLSLEEARVFVSEGAKWPNAALVSLYRYPEKLSDADLKALRKLDQEIDGAGFEADQYKRLRTGIVAMLSQNGDQESQAYLRQVWRRSPDRRQAIAVGLSQYPNDENWDYLIRSLPVLETYAAAEVMNAIRTVPLGTDDYEAYREVILQGLRMVQQGENPAPALALLQHWTGKKDAANQDRTTIESWQSWYATMFPDRPEAALPQPDSTATWNVETLTEYFNSSDGKRGEIAAGKKVFEAANCAACHRVDQGGGSIGPDLSNIAKRFTRKEVMEAIMFPSHVISDQYASKRLLTTDGKVYNGIVSNNRDGSLTVRQSNLEEVVVAEQDIEEIQTSKVSVMPSGLLDNLTAEQIRDMFAYMGFLAPQEVAKTPTSPELR